MPNQEIVLIRTEPSAYDSDLEELISQEKCHLSKSQRLLLINDILEGLLFTKASRQVLRKKIISLLFRDEPFKIVSRDIEKGLIVYLDEFQKMTIGVDWDIYKRIN